MIAFYRLNSYEPLHDHQLKFHFLYDLSLLKPLFRVSF